MPRITLPDGARGITMDGSDRYTGRPGDTVNVSTGHAAAIAKFGRSSHGGERFAFGTKTGRHCLACERVWNAWSVTCPRCAAATVLAEG